MRKSLGSNPEINKIFLLNKGTKQLKHYRIKGNVGITGQLINANSPPKQHFNSIPHKAWAPFQRESIIRSPSNLYFPEEFILFWLPTLRLREAKFCTGWSHDTISTSCNCPQGGSTPLVFKPQVAQAQIQPVSPGLWVRALCSLRGCFSWPRAPSASVDSIWALCCEAYTQAGRPGPGRKHRPRTGAPVAPMAFTFKVRLGRPTNRSTGGHGMQKEADPVQPKNYAALGQLEATTHFVAKPRNVSTAHITLLGE